MNAKTFLTTVVFIYSHLITAQVLYTEDFETFTLGNLGIQPPGQTPGQGGWYIMGTSAAQQIQIENEPGKGKVLTIRTLPVGNNGGTQVYKKDFETIWSQRTPGCNVLKLEFDFFTPDYPANPSGSVSNDFQIYTTYPIPLAGYGYSHIDGRLIAGSSKGPHHFHFGLGANGNNLYLSKNQWHKLLFYVDYDNNRAFFEVPALGIVKKVDVFDQLTPPDTMDNYPPTRMHLSVGKEKREDQPTFVKYDNIKMTALNAVPPHLLNTAGFLSEKFNVFPNPATDIVSITSSENIGIGQIEVYDISGKIVKTQTFSNESEIQLNTGGFAPGTYFLHIQTGEGTAVEKVVKK